MNVEAGDLFKAMVTNLLSARPWLLAAKVGSMMFLVLTDIFPNDSSGTTIRINGYFVTGFDGPSVSRAGIDIVQAD